MEDIQNYFNRSGRFKDLDTIKETVRVQAMQKVIPHILYYFSVLISVQKQNPNPLDVYDMFSYPGHNTADPPFLQLAKRILSVTANSASCERLFSVFGNTLTKLRNRLGTKTLSNLAELKMLVRDEHIRLGESKDRLKRKFGQDLPSDVIETPVVPPAERPETHSEIPAVEMEEPDQTIDPSSSADAAEEGEFASMAAEMEQMLQQDEDATDLPSLPGGNTCISVKITDLFDFSKEWGRSHIETARQSLAEEIELSELVDRGAVVSDDGGSVGLDPVTEAVLRGF
jgi:hypothetical protein